MSSRPDRTTILGIPFFNGTVKEAVERMIPGGLLVVPAAPALKNLASDARYREALMGADVVITDSAFMVLSWNILQRDSVQRLSGLRYLRHLLKQEELRRPGNTLWVFASAESAERNRKWLERQGITVPAELIYVAPVYGDSTDDPALLAKIEGLKPGQVVITIGGGVQEQLGYYLKRNLSYRPAIHCIGAAIAFLTGDQVLIPMWADRLYLGWLFRSLWKPQLYVPRYWDARKLFELIRRYRHRSPAAAE